MERSDTHRSARPFAALICRRSGLCPRCVCFAPWFPASLRRARELFVSPPRASYFLKRQKVTKGLAPPSGFSLREKYPRFFGVSGGERHGCRGSRDGPGMALRGVPLKLRFNEGIFRPKRKTGCPGQAFLVTSLAFERSNSPEGAKQKIRAHAEATQETKARGRHIADGVRSYE